MTSKRSYASLQPLFEAGFQGVLLLFFARFAWRSKWWPKSAIGAFCSIAIAAGWPLVLELLLLPAVPNAALHTRLAILWLVAVSALDALVMICAWYAWNLWVKAASSMDDLIPDNSARERLLQWYIKMIAVTRRILRLEGLRLIWHSPAGTPAIIKLSRGYGFCACAALIAAFSIEFLAFQVSSYGKNGLLSALTIFVPSFTGAITLFVGLAPHFWLYGAVRDARQRTLGGLDLLIGEKPPGTRQAAERLYQHVELYRLVENSPGLPFSTAAMVQYAAAVLGSLVAYFLGR